MTKVEKIFLLFLSKIFYFVVHNKTLLPILVIFRIVRKIPGGNVIQTRKKENSSKEHKWIILRIILAFDVRENLSREVVEEFSQE